MSGQTERERVSRMQRQMSTGIEVHEFGARRLTASVAFVQCSSFEARSIA